MWLDCPGSSSLLSAYSLYAFSNTRSLSTHVANSIVALSAKLVALSAKLVALSAKLVALSAKLVALSAKLVQR